MPSIRELARQLRVGDGVVRRAYRELRDMGLLLTEDRKHVVGRSAEAAASKMDLVRASTERCDQLIAWAKEHQLSAIALSRFLFRQVSAREAASPSYVFVDICRLAAERSAARISKAWDIRVAGMSVSDFTARWRTDARNLSAILVHQHLYEDVITVTGEDAHRVFSVKVRLDERIRRRISRLSPRSTILFVCGDEDFARTCRAMLRHCEYVFGQKRRFQFKNVSDIPDLSRLLQARTQKFRLFLFSPIVWDTLPTRIKRMVTVAPAFSEPDPQSLEETRIAAGVLF